MPNSKSSSYNKSCCQNSILKAKNCPLDSQRQGNLDKIYVNRMFKTSINKGIFLILYLTLLITISLPGSQGK